MKKSKKKVLTNRSCLWYNSSGSYDRVWCTRLCLLYRLYCMYVCMYVCVVISTLILSVYVWVSVLVLLCIHYTVTNAYDYHIIALVIACAIELAHLCVVINSHYIITQTVCLYVYNSSVVNNMLLVIASSITIASLINVIIVSTSLIYLV